MQFKPCHLITRIYLRATSESVTCKLEISNFLFYHKTKSLTNHLIFHYVGRFAPAIGDQQFFHFPNSKSDNTFVTVIYDVHKKFETEYSHNYAFK